VKTREVEFEVEDANKDTNKDDGKDEDARSQGVDGTDDTLLFFMVALPRCFLEAEDAYRRASERKTATAG
jgi:hypothetical protein